MQFEQVSFGSRPAAITSRRAPRPSVTRWRFMGGGLLCLALLVVGLPARAELFEATLYDGIEQAVTPDNYDPQWLAFGDLGGSQSYDTTNQFTKLNTWAVNDIKDGYSNYAVSLVSGISLVNPQFPALDRSQSYSIGFRLEILSERHARDERAGFSVIAISSDVAPGLASSIEIGFQDGRVFSQNDSFGAELGEVSDFDPVGVGLVDYLLTIDGSRYDLMADGSSILSGGLRDYTSFTGLIDPYEIPDYLFLGDDTSSAAADINLQRVTVSAGRVPEPSSWLLMGLGLCGLGLYRRRRRQARPV